MRAIADAHLDDIGDQARLFALVSLASADAAISCLGIEVPLQLLAAGDRHSRGRQRRQPAALRAIPNWVPFIPSPPYPDHSSGANNLAGSITGPRALFRRRIRVLDHEHRRRVCW